MARDKEAEDDVIVDLEQQEDKQDKGKRVAQADSDIEVVDDTPPEDRRPPRRSDFKSAVPTEDEIGAYTKGVQERLRKMSYEVHEERRAKESALRENERAIAFGRQMLERNQRLEKMIEDGSKVLKESSTKSAETEISAIKGALAQAIQAGDNSAVADLNEKLGRATARAESAAQMQTMKFDPAKPPEFLNDRRIPEQEMRAPEITEANRRWMERNPWFGEDQRMTAIAMSAHESLLRDGIRVESKAYYEGIDKEMREMFPDYRDWNEDGKSRPPRRSNVAPTLRTPARQTGKVTLTLSEQKVAAKLGVPLKDYAAQKLRMQQEQDNG